MENKQLSFAFDYGCNDEQACIMCHLSSECGKCCNRCISSGTTCGSQQICSRLSKENEGPRWESWLHITEKGEPLHELRRFIPNPLRKKYHL